MTDDDLLPWRSREAELEKEYTPHWKIGMLRRENMIQLFNELIDRDLDYEVFSSLYNDELKKYAEAVNDSRNSSIDEEVEKLVPDFKKKLSTLSSGLSTDHLLQNKHLKRVIQNCKILNEPTENELKNYGNHILLTRRRQVTENSAAKPVNQTRKDQSIITKWKVFRPEDAKSTEFQEVPKKSKYKFIDEKSKRSKRKFEKEENDEIDIDIVVEKKNPFKSAREQLDIDRRKNKHPSPQGTNSNPVKKSLGARPRNGCYSKFIPPTVKDQENEQTSRNKQVMDVDSDPRLKGIEPKIIELVTNEIMDHGPPVQWDDIAGLEFAKTTIKEIVIWPMLRPDIFTGLRGPPKGILLFGPPGTGKTLIGKCIACQSGATFFSISASSLTSKWVGEGEKMVRALFAVASCHQPAVIFIDEIDSLLAQRSDTEHESSRRIKTEFLVQLDGAATSSEERILVVGATNRPQEIDEAARRRLSKRLYIPLPEANARKQIVKSLLQKQDCELPDEDVVEIVMKTDGYSGADMANLCREAALGPIRSLQGVDISAISKEDVRPIIVEDFKTALQRVRPSVSAKDLDLFQEWNKQFGCCNF